MSFQGCCRSHSPSKLQKKSKLFTPFRRHQGENEHRVVKASLSICKGNNCSFCHQIPGLCHLTPGSSMAAQGCTQERSRKGREGPALPAEMLCCPAKENEKLNLMEMFSTAQMASHPCCHDRHKDSAILLSTQSPRAKPSQQTALVETPSAKPSLNTPH